MSDWCADVSSSDLKQRDGGGDFHTLAPAAIVAAEEGVGQVHICNTSSLRAQRSNPERFTHTLDCFAALAMTERQNLLRRHLVASAAALGEFVDTGAVGGFGRLGGGVLGWRRVSSALGRLVGMERVW